MIAEAVIFGYGGRVTRSWRPPAGPADLQLLLRGRWNQNLGVHSYPSKGTTMVSI